MAELSLPEKIVAVDVCLSRAKIGHAFGGALALAYYAEPRATIDIDVNLFVEPSQFAAVAGALAPLGVDLSVDDEALRRDGQCRLTWGRTPLDLFFAYDALHDEMKGAARRVPFAETTIPILSPEHLAVCKAVFDRPKDWIDIEQMLVVADEIDRAEIERWLVRIVGRKDDRTRRFKRLAGQLL
jgi:hypothetical protein